MDSRTDTEKNNTTKFVIDVIKVLSGGGEVKDPTLKEMDEHIAFFKEQYHKWVKVRRAHLAKERRIKKKAGS